ncbi:MAG: hypothetical protein JKX76_01810 [Colwellia sp.]|nr:hypothetical protein [Colwellia sp.]
MICATRDHNDLRCAKNKNVLIKNNLIINHLNQMIDLTKQVPVRSKFRNIEEVWSGPLISNTILVEAKKVAIPNKLQNNQQDEIEIIADDKTGIYAFLNYTEIYMYLPSWFKQRGIRSRTCIEEAPNQCFNTRCSCLPKYNVRWTHAVLKVVSIKGDITLINDGKTYAEQESTILKIFWETMVKSDFKFEWIGRIDHKNGLLSITEAIIQDTFCLYIDQMCCNQTFTCKSQLVLPIDPYNLSKCALCKVHNTFKRNSYSKLFAYSRYLHETRKLWQTYEERYLEGTRRTESEGILDSFVSSSLQRFVGLGPVRIFNIITSFFNPYLIDMSVDERDILLVISQTSCSKHDAIKALKNNNSDIVNAIMELTM